MVLLGIIGVFERKQNIEDIAVSFKNVFHDVEVIESIDYSHNGYNWNMKQLLRQVVEVSCKTRYDYIFMTTDDIKICDENFKANVEQALKDYEVAGCFSNRISNSPARICDGTGKHVLYDQCVCFRGDFFDEDYYKRFCNYCAKEGHTVKELNHYDVMHSHFIRDEKRKICVIRPNQVKHVLKSVLGHNVKIEEQE